LNNLTSNPISVFANNEHGDILGHRTV